MKNLYWLMIFLFVFSDTVHAQVNFGTVPDLMYWDWIRKEKSSCTSGKCRQGNTGTLEFKEGKFASFTGEFGDHDVFKNGKLVFTNGDVYEGSFVLNGTDLKYAKLCFDKGTYTMKSGNSVTGTFTAGLYITGDVTYHFASGARYKGTAALSKPEGKGIMIWDDGSTYEGNWSAGFKDGYGVDTYTGGLVYKGYYVKNVRSGDGAFTNLKKPGYFFSGPFKDNYVNGFGKLVKEGSSDTLIGNFNNGYANGIFQLKKIDGTSTLQYYKNDSLLYASLVRLEKGYCIGGNCKTGKGTALSDEGDMYEGEFKDGKKEGQGKQTYKSGAVYTGPFKNNEPNGKGVFVYTDKSVYEGEVKDGFLNGKGVMKWGDGSTYEGDWVKNVVEGKGVKHFDAGNAYYGEFANNRPHGKGVYLWLINGKRDKYVGDWSNGLITGKGIRYFENGDRYEGYFNNGSLSGTGTYIFATGDKYESNYWNGHSFQSGSFYAVNTSVAQQGRMDDFRFLNSSYVDCYKCAAKGFVEEICDICNSNGFLYNGHKLPPGANNSVYLVGTNTYRDSRNQTGCSRCSNGSKSVFNSGKTYHKTCTVCNGSKYVIMKK